MKKTYIHPRIKTLQVEENLMNFDSVNNEVGDGNQLGKEMNPDDFEEEDFDESFGAEQYENIWD